MSPVSCERREDRLLYVAGALDEAGQARFEEHLSGCGACARVVDAAFEAMGEDESDEPTSGSLERVRTRLGRRMREPAAIAPARGAASPSPRWRTALAAGVGALLLAAGAWLAHQRVIDPLREENQALAHGLAQLRETQSALEARLDDLRGTLARSRREVDLLRAEDLVEVAMTATRPASDARARIFWHAETYRCYVVAHGLPPLGPGRRYALWVSTGDGQTIPVGSFRVNADGSAEIYAELPDGTRGITRVLLTDEPADEAAVDGPSGSEHLVWLRPT
jgi:hypothetical protein